MNVSQFIQEPYLMLWYAIICYDITMICHYTLYADFMTGPSLLCDHTVMCDWRWNKEVITEREGHGGHCVLVTVQHKRCVIMGCTTFKRRQCKLMAVLNHMGFIWDHNDIISTLATYILNTDWFSYPMYIVTCVTTFEEFPTKEYKIFEDPTI